MPVIAVPMEVVDMKYLQEQGALHGVSDYLTDDKLEQLKKTECYTFLNSEQKIIACAGIIEYWPGRVEAWMFFHPNCKKDFLGIYKVVKKFLKTRRFRRVEATVNKAFVNGHRWVKAFGFQLEAETLRKYGLFGEDSSLYALVEP
ncbi:MAG TPA: hypothetical protein PK473_03035 [Nitrosomonas sp.]|nr:hypothetical protein [Agitococcus sp.]HNA69985.1 hypothetical protein [Nitrosomonas sp.]